MKECERLRQEFLPEAKAEKELFDYNIVLIGFMGAGKKYDRQYDAGSVFYGSDRDGSGDRGSAGDEYTGDF